VIARLVTPSDFAALAALFERDHSPCYCRYYHFTGTNKEWEARCAVEPEKNREELQGALEGTGVVAVDADAIVGWMKLVPQRTLTKLLARSPYKGLESPDTYSIGCFLVDPTRRRQGVARAMVEAAIPIARALGATYLEAYPRVFEGMHEGEQWTGPYAMFESLGFAIHRDQPQYPVMRKRLL